MTQLFPRGRGPSAFNAYRYNPSFRVSNRTWDLVHSGWAQDFEEPFAL